MPRKVPSNFILFAVAILCAACGDRESTEPRQNAPSDSDTAAERNAFALTGFSLLDGLSPELRHDLTMIVENGRVAEIGPAGEVSLPTGIETSDLSGKVIMPGIIDLHVHLALNDGSGMSADNYTREFLEEDLARYARYGVTAVLSLGTDKSLVFDLVRDQRNNKPSTTRVFTAGQGLVFEGGYGGVPELNDPISTPADIEQVLQKQVDQGADFAKIWVDDEFKTMPKMPNELTQAALDAASRLGLRILAHIFYLDDAKYLAANGIAGFVHSVRDQPVDAEFVSLMQENGVWQAALSLSREASMFRYVESPGEFFDDPFFRGAVPEETLERILSNDYRETARNAAHFDEYPRVFEQASANAKALHEGGVNIAFGTDSGPPGRFPGYAAHWELELLVNAGFTPFEALQSATANAAEFLQQDDLGVIRPGAWADFVILDDNPLTDIRNTRKIVDVFIAGERVRRDGL